MEHKASPLLPTFLRSLAHQKRLSVKKVGALTQLIVYLLINCIPIQGQASHQKISTIIVSFNTLFRPNPQLIKEYVQSILTLRNYISLLIKGIPDPAQAKSELFGFLETVPPLKNLLPTQAWQSHYPPYETAGYKFPPIFCQMIVSQTVQQEQAILKAILESLKNYSGITSKTRKKIMKAVIETLFQSKLMNSFVNPFPHVILFFEELKTQGYQLILVGNVPGYSWQGLLNHPKTAQLQKLFPPSHRYISGEKQLLKTSPEMYNLILKDHNLDPHECLVIDSTLLNLRYPYQLGMTVRAFDVEKESLQALKKLVTTALAS